MVSTVDPPPLEELLLDELSPDELELLDDEESSVVVSTSEEALLDDDESSVVVSTLEDLLDDESSL